MDRENAPPPSTKLRHLPEEIIEEIRSRLPVKSLLRFRCVSKSWRCLISSERFIRTQLEKSSKDPTAAHWQVMFNCDSKFSVLGLQQCSVRSYLDDPDADPSPIPDPTNHHLSTHGYLVGNCDGLLCILKKPGCLFLWNPATRISIELPKLDLDMVKYGFDRDKQSGAYKVFVVGSRYEEEEEEWIGKLYGSKTNSWETVVDHGCHHIGCGPEAAMLMYGKLHWMFENSKDYIFERFNLESEVFEITSPKEWFRDIAVAEDRWMKENTPAGYEPVFMTRAIENKIRHKNIDRNCRFWNYVYVESLVSPNPHNNL